MKKSVYVMTPLLILGALALGLYVGYALNSGQDQGFIQTSRSSGDKFSKIVRFVEEQYVDTVATGPLVDQAIQDFLQDLDPHSYYISADERNRYSEPLQGGFEGIGVEYRIQKDTIVVINPVSGGPSELVGIRAGDRIVTVEDSTIAGTGISNRDVQELLRGKGGTKVNVGVYRKKQGDELLSFTITRGKIPIKSVTTWLSINDETAYVRITQFAKNTLEEFRIALDEVDVKNKSKLIIDLRGNGGGYLHTATELADEFLDTGDLIVYTEGRASGRRTYEASRSGSLDDMKVVILIDEGSASASEILAGAMQDHDRGTIIGRRSFGKGLVQEEKELSDRSAMRLTIARYYTPTGRSIQKPYGEGVDYQNDYFERLERGELLSADSIDFPDSLKFTTPGGKTVYGGGGIMPDIFVPVDTSGNSEYLNELFYNGVLNDYAFDYADKHRDRLKAMTAESFEQNFKISNSDLNVFIDYAVTAGVPRDQDGINTSKEELRYRLKAAISRNIFGDEGYYRVILNEDNVFEAAMDYLEN